MRFGKVIKYGLEKQLNINIMKQESAKTFSLFLSIAFIGFLSIKYPTNPWSLLVVGLLINIISAPISFFIIDILENLTRIPLLVKTKIKYRNKYVRLSFSYLFIIKVKGKYLLVKNRNGNYYQLVGGAYKRYQSSENIFNKYKVKPDRQFETSHGIAKSDLRFQILGRYVTNILSWFHSKEGREISQWREFCEELLTTNILPKEEFRYIDYKYLDTLFTPLQKARNLDCQEMLIYEIFEFIPTHEQLQILEKKLDDGDSNEIKWADEIIINAKGFNELTKKSDYQIGVHTKWAVNLKYTNE